MQNVNAQITFSLSDAEGNVRHVTDVKYYGLDEVQVLLIEKHMIAAMAGVNAEASEQLRG